MVSNREAQMCLASISCINVGSVRKTEATVCILSARGFNIEN